jgi:NADH-quinone oxidoreductase subunit N
MLAYSSVAHSGYMAVPLVVMMSRGGSGVAPADCRDAVAYYMLAYTLMTLLAFGVLIASGEKGEGRIAQWAGVARRRPAVAALMALAMVALVGIPPTVGFLGKVKLFAVAVAGRHVGLAVIAVVASVASAYYYLRVVVTLYMREEPEQPAAARRTLTMLEGIVLGVVAAGLIGFALFPFV